MGQERENIEQNLKCLEENIKRMNRFNEIKDTPIISYRHTTKHINLFLKKLVKKSIFWFIKPYWEQQIEFNQSVLGAIQDIYRVQCSQFNETPLETLETIDTEYQNFIEYKGARIIQIVSSLNYGDAVGNDVIAIQDMLKNNGFVTGIFTNNIHPKIELGIAYKIEKMPKLKENDIVLYHFASEDPLSELIKTLPCKVILRYHNITPPEFFKGFDSRAEKNTRIGLKQIKELKDYIDYGMVVSEFNKQDLIKMGYTCPINVVPIIIKFEDYEQKPDQEIIKKYSDGITNLLFVGRIAPNKKFEDIISCFAEYKKQCDATARLFLVGNYSEDDKYYQFLQWHIKKLGVDDVIFSGHIPFTSILAYYSIADIFLCMSEHEGFCVPLVEAMYFQVPIIAYDSTAIASTLGGSGVLVKEKDYVLISNEINKIRNNKIYERGIILAQCNRLEKFSNEQIKNNIRNNIKYLLDYK